jgi:hypothetical protein
MSRCPNKGELRAWLDGEWPATNRLVVESHLESCPACRQHMDRLEKDRAWVSHRMARIASRSDAIPPAGQALAQLYHRIETRPHWKERLADMFGLTHRHARPALAALALVLIVTLAFGFEPVRVAAQDFLSIFRVRQFAVIPVGPEQMEKMEEISALLEQNFFLGEPIMAQESELRNVATLQEAIALTGFRVRTLETVPRGFSAQAIEVSSEGSGQLQVDLALARSLFETLGLDPALLPDSLGKEPLTIIIPAMVTQSWRYQGRIGLNFVQGRSPSVDYPDDVDPVALGASVLQLLGMSEREAGRLSETIDWTSTLVLPIPTDVASFRELPVDGTTGLLINAQTDRHGSHNSLLWQRDGVLHFLEGNVSMETLVEIAGSIR